MSARVGPTHRLLLAAVAGVWAAGCAGPPQPTGQEQAAEAFVNVRGGTYRLPGPDTCKAVALIFVGLDCPIANGYAPEIARLHDEFAPRGAAFCVVYADADLTPDAARAHAAEYGYPCPAVLDPGMTLARKVGATVTPEAAVLSPAGDLLYRGRIDDTYAGFGVRRSRPTSRELKDALDAVLAGRPVPVARTAALGCDIVFPTDNP